MPETLVSRIRELEDAEIEEGRETDLNVYRRTRDLYRRAAKAMGRRQEFSESVKNAREVGIQNDAGGSTKILDGRRLA